MERRGVVEHLERLKKEAVGEATLAYQLNRTRINTEFDNQRRVVMQDENAPQKIEEIEERRREALELSKNDYQKELYKIQHQYEKELGEDTSLWEVEGVVLFAEPRTIRRRSQST